jgi:carbon monoxide dehydrogenase subunit G
LPQVSYTTILGRAISPVWDFVQDMNNWASFVTGYKKHEQQSDTDSVWTVRGDVGMLSREVQLQVHIAEWVDAERVRFQLKGVNEAVQGEGCLTIRPLSAGDALEVIPKKRFFLFRWMDRLFSFFYRRKHGSVQRSGVAAEAKDRCELTFTLSMNAQGPMGPMVNVMLAPLLRPAAEDLANRIAAALETTAEPEATDAPKTETE